MSTNNFKSNNHVKSCLGFMSQSLFDMNDGVSQQTIISNIRKDLLWSWNMSTII